MGGGSREVSGDVSTRRQCLAFGKTNLLRNVCRAHSSTVALSIIITLRLGRWALFCGLLSWGFWSEDSSRMTGSSLMQKKKWKICQPGVLKGLVFMSRKNGHSCWRSECRCRFLPHDQHRSKSNSWIIISLRHKWNFKSYIVRRLRWISVFHWSGFLKKPMMQVFMFFWKQNTPQYALWDEFLWLSSPSVGCRCDQKRAQHSTLWCFSLHAICHLLAL